MNSQLSVIQNVPELDNYEPAGLDMCPEYWTPEQEGESRRMAFVCVAPRRMQSADNPDDYIELECAIFVQPVGAAHRLVANGSKRLVGVFEGDAVAPGTPFEITYLGKRKNSSNSFQSDSWSVVELKPKGGE